jgi:hypothetical protein
MSLVPLYDNVISMYGEIISQLSEKVVKILIKNFKRD